MLSVLKIVSFASSILEITFGIMFADLSICSVYMQKPASADCSVKLIHGCLFKFKEMLKCKFLYCMLSIIP